MVSEILTVSDRRHARFANRLTTAAAFDTAMKLALALIIYSSFV